MFAVEKIDGALYVADVNSPMREATVQLLDVEIEGRCTLESIIDVGPIRRTGGGR